MLRGEGDGLQLWKCNFEWQMRQLQTNWVKRSTWRLCCWHSKVPNLILRPADFLGLVRNMAHLMNFHNPIQALSRKSENDKVSIRKFVHWETLTCKCTFDGVSLGQWVRAYPGWLWAKSVLHPGLVGSQSQVTYRQTSIHTHTFGEFRVFYELNMFLECGRKPTQARRVRAEPKQEGQKFVKKPKIQR